MQKLQNKAKNECEAKIKEFKKKTINGKKIRNMNELILKFDQKTI